MLQARPLFDNAADARFFVAPSEWGTIVRALERRLNVMVIGERGSGKTTLLRQLQAALRQQAENVVFADAASAESSLDLVRRIRDQMTGQLSPPLDATVIAGASRTVEADLRTIGQVDPSIVLVDASHAGAAVYEVFGRLRDALWQFEHLWVVAIDDSERATALRPPADAFFDVVVDLEGLSTDQLTRMLELRSPDTPAATLRHVAANANGNPRRAVRALSEAYARGTDPANDLAAAAQLETVASLLGRPHGMLMGELLQRGQASASDATLQRSLGVSRARLNQLLRELLEHQLVRQEVEVPSGPGRPRTVYRPALR